jgi:hypothetical protein
MRANERRWRNIFMPSAEHQFLVSELDQALQRYANTGLFGIAEAERKKFDYGCLLLRDLSRPLIAQALWAHPEGVDKDLRTLLHDSEAVLKVYFVRHTTPHCIRIDEVLQSYRLDPVLRTRLTGLRLVPVPGDFDADSEHQRSWMTSYLEDRIVKDLLFGVVFGNLTAHDFLVFTGHGGPMGLKYAILDEVLRGGLHHMPTFKQELRYKTDGPIREALTMLTAAGFIRRVANSNVCIPAIKGRLMLDLSRRLLFEFQSQGGWTPETRSILGVLGLPNPKSPHELNSMPFASDDLRRLLEHCVYCRTEFGRDLLASIEPGSPVFHSEFEWQHIFAKIAAIPGVSSEVFDEPASLFFASRTAR